MKQGSARAQTGQRRPPQRSGCTVRRFCASTTDAFEAAALLRVFSSAKRLLILHELIAASELSAGKLAQTVGVSQAALSQHLMKLREAKLLRARREGRHIYYRISNATAIRRAIRDIDHLLR
jgi:DNA-binding transcriptional ArsR family regulator